MLSLPRVQSLVRKIRSDKLLVYWGGGGRGADTWRQWNSLDWVCRIGLVPLGASLLRDGATGRREENWGLVPSPVLGGRWLQAALVGEARGPWSDTGQEG